jgi:hypothetical protein
MSIDVSSVDGPRCTGPTFGCCPSMRWMLMALNVWDLPLVVVHRCVLQMFNLEVILYNELTTQWQKRTQYDTLHIYTYGLYVGIRHYIFIDSEMHLPTLKWKTDKSKIKFFFAESFPLQRELFTGRECKGSFITLSLSHWYHWLCRPNPVKLTPCGIKKTHRDT